MMPFSKMPLFACRTAVWRSRRALALVALAAVLALPPLTAPSAKGAADATQREQTAEATPATATPASAPSVSPWNVCAIYAHEAEQILGLPPFLLQAIAKVESSRWNKSQKAAFAWPWTVMAEGQGRFFPTKEAAIAHVEALKKRGIRNIDVGCMQVNLHYHGRHFASLEQAMNPAINVAYAASYLARLRGEHKSWTKAIGNYHSATPHLSGRYRTKVFRQWRAEKRAAYAAGSLTGRPRTVLKIAQN